MRRGEKRKRKSARHKNVHKHGDFAGPSDISALTNLHRYHFSIRARETPKQFFSLFLFSFLSCTSKSTVPSPSTSIHDFSSRPLENVRTSFSWPLTPIGLRFIFSGNGIVVADFDLSDRVCRIESLSVRLAVFFLHCLVIT